MIKNKKNILVFISMDFPYEGSDSIFIKPEMPFLLEKFDRIIIIAIDHIICSEKNFIQHSDKIVFPIEVIKSANKNKNNVSNYFSTLILLLKVIFLSKKNKRSYLKNFRYFFSYLRTLNSIAKSLHNYLEENHHFNDTLTFYSFWFDAGATIFSILADRIPSITYYSRAHGFDLYEYRSQFGFAPFRQFQFEKISKIFCVSEKGRAHLIENYPEFKDKIEVHYLGTGSGSINVKKNSDELLIVSCSRIVDLKRVHLIPEVLKGLNGKVKWLHFGDGPLLNKVQEACSLLPGNIKYELLGNIANNEIIEFYSANYIDLFIHVSETEGIPVSMMEAISFGIPVFSTNVGGVSEIVNETTGKLYNPSPEIFIPDFTHDINNQIYNNFNREEIIQFWNTNFNADKNYKKFSNIISFNKNSK